MPIVFVHGVATRQTPAYEAAVTLRDQLFRELVVPKDAEIYNPDWGSGAVKLSASDVWLPAADGHESLAAAGGAPAAGAFARLASSDPAAAVDALFTATLEARAASGSAAPLSESELRVFRAAVDYLELGVDRDAFAADAGDAAAFDALASELGHQMPRPEVEPMGGLDPVFGWLKDGAKSIWDPLANATSDSILRRVRRPLSEMVALFLGDIFVYLRRRDSGQRDSIFGPVVTDLAKAAKARSDADPLIVVGHSLGGVILCDLLSDPDEIKRIETAATAPLTIDALVTVGSQPGLFADMGLYQRPGHVAGTLLPRPSVVRNWLNIFDFTDVLAFKAGGAFTDVLDFAFDNKVGLLNAHTSYFLRPGFYQRLRKRLKDAAVLR